MTVGEVKKGRGRPPKKSISYDEEHIASTDEVVSNNPSEDETEDALAEEPKKKRGRPSKKTNADEADEALNEDPKKKRGRPSKKVSEDETEDAVAEESKKKRGRPSNKENLEDEVVAEDPDEKDSLPRAKKSSAPVAYKEDSASESEESEGEEYEEEEENSGDDYDPKKSAKKMPSKIKIKKKSAGRGRPRKDGGLKAGPKSNGRGRPPGSGGAKKKASSPVHYLYDLDDSSDSELDDGAKSDASEDMNYRPWGECKVKKRKVSGTKKEEGSDDGDNWRPGKDFPGLKAKPKNKTKARKVSQDGEGLPPKKRGRPAKNKDSEKKIEEEIGGKEQEAIEA